MNKESKGKSDFNFIFQRTMWVSYLFHRESLHVEIVHDRNVETVHRCSFIGADQFGVFYKLCSCGKER